MTEDWIPVPGSETHYEVSNHGRVRSLPRRVQFGNVYRDVPTRILKPRRVGKGYMGVDLWVNHEVKKRTVHRLVLDAFTGPKPAGHVCRHLNGDPTDNRLENLCWGTYTENRFDTIAHGRDHYAKRTHCKHGHEFNAENTQYTDTGKRICRVCSRDGYARRRYGVSA